MRRFSSAFAGAVVALLAGAAQAAGHPAVDSAQNLCLQPHGVAATALARAEADGWTVPDAATRAGLASVVGPDGDVRIKNEATGIRMLILSRHAPMFAEQGLDADVCGVLTNVSAEDPVGALTALFGSPPTHEDGTFHAWAFDERGGDYKWLGKIDGDTAAAAFNGGKAVMVAGAAMGEMSAVFYLRRAAP